ncbi:MAG: DUF2807 domain-containing protein [Betaproteobacteria bacterium]|nr:DUF2807 domain-containing protein [Betaproteobacteria bacterium]
MMRTAATTRPFRWLAKAATAFACILAMLPQAAHADWNWGWGKKVTGSGVSKTETRQVSGFSGLSLGVSAKVEIRQGSSESVTITGDDNIVPLVETVVEDGKLKVRWTERNLNTSYKVLKLVVEAKTMESIGVAGSGDVVAETLSAKTFSANVAGSGDIRINNLIADNVTAKIAGSGDMEFGGKAGSLETKISGSGDIRAGKLETKTSSVSIAGSGNVTLWAAEKLRVSVAGSGDVRYYGDPEVSKSVAGSGNVKRLGKSPNA